MHGDSAVAVEGRSIGIATAIKSSDRLRVFCSAVECSSTASTSSVGFVGVAPLASFPVVNAGSVWCSLSRGAARSSNECSTDFSAPVPSRPVCDRFGFLVNMSTMARALDIFLKVALAFAEFFDSISGTLVEVLLRASCSGRSYAGLIPN